MNNRSPLIPTHGIIFFTEKGYDADQEIAEHAKGMEPFFDQALERQFPEAGIIPADIDSAVLSVSGSHKSSSGLKIFKEDLGDVRKI